MYTKAKTTLASISITGPQVAASRATGLKKNTGTSEVNPESNRAIIFADHRTTKKRSIWATVKMANTDGVCDMKVDNQ